MFIVGTRGFVLKYKNGYLVHGLEQIIPWNMTYDTSNTLFKAHDKGMYDNKGGHVNLGLSPLSK